MSSSRATDAGFERVGRPGEGGRAEGADAGALFAVGHALDVAAEHPGIGEQVMGEADGLRGLEVGAAGEDGVLMFFGAGHVYGGQFAGEALPFARARSETNRRKSSAT